jgi:predicted DNA-binding transcriptional regulator AlpA
MVIEADGFIGARKTRQLLDNCSQMHLWRLLNDERYRHLKFPRPFKLRQRNYWRVAAVQEWLRAMAGEATPAE